MFEKLLIFIVFLIFQAATSCNVDNELDIQQCFHQYYYDNFYIEENYQENDFLKIIENLNDEQKLYFCSDFIDLTNCLDGQESFETCFTPKNIRFWWNFTEEESTSYRNHFNATNTTCTLIIQKYNAGTYVIQNADHDSNDTFVAIPTEGPPIYEHYANNGGSPVNEPAESTSEPGQYPLNTGSSGLLPTQPSLAIGLGIQPTKTSYSKLLKPALRALKPLAKPAFEKVKPHLVNMSKKIGQKIHNKASSLKRTVKDKVNNIKNKVRNIKNRISSSRSKSTSSNKSGKKN